MNENVVLFFSTFLIIFSGILGLILGWIANENYTYFLRNLGASRLPVDHPEMFDENGNPIHSELYSVRFEEDDDDEE